MQSDGMGEAPSAYVNGFRNSIPYINAHRGKTFVVAFPGEAVAAPRFPQLIQDVVLLHSLGIRVVLVHGARPQIDQRLEESQLPIQIAYHRRVTDQASLQAVTEAIGRTAIQVQSQLVQCMAAAHLNPANSVVSSGNYVIAKPFGVHNGIDYQHSGEVRKIRQSAIHQHLDLGHLVLLSPLGYSPTGESFNLLWEEVAEAAATALKADKIVYFSGEEGILNDQNQLVRELTVPEANTLISEQISPHYTLISARDAVTKGINRAHIISYHRDGALLQELFTLDGTGTLITQQIYEKVRLASVDDVASLLELIEPLEQQGVLVRRSRELLENEIQHFTLIERDDKIIACAALYPFMEEHCGELACVVVHPEYRQGSRGDALLKAIEQRAAMLGLTSLFVLTTRTAHWFMERGFRSAAISELPQHKQSLYNYQRNSKVFVKRLTTEP
ncbi:amino-acid N-acetyltransferase [Ketobacter sp.]|uniref:amino-acid N-acetyltransferase n=1 Tax=Ketobacter sp. TaxID=2083498 RepID=UPI0025BCFC71|nr:amino-acid N-acetyltransferase [Ketobacter sp.]